MLTTHTKTIWCLRPGQNIFMRIQKRFNFMQCSSSSSLPPPPKQPPREPVFYVYVCAQFHTHIQTYPVVYDRAIIYIYAFNTHVWNEKKKKKKSSTKYPPKKNTINTRRKSKESSHKFENNCFQYLHIQILKVYTFVLPIYKKTYDYILLYARAREQRNCRRKNAFFSVFPVNARALSSQLRIFCSQVLARFIWKKSDTCGARRSGICARRERCSSSSRATNHNMECVCVCVCCARDYILCAPVLIETNNIQQTIIISQLIWKYFNCIECERI